MTSKRKTSELAAFGLVIFDLDGTLVDSVPDIAWSLNNVRAELNLPPLPVETVTRFVGDGAGTLIERGIPADAIVNRPATSVLLQRFVQRYAGHVCVDTRLFPGIDELLEQLSRAGVPMGVITNKPHDLTRDLLSALSIARHFDVVIGDGDGFPRKPDPAAARSTLARLGVDPQRTVVVGDGLPDIRMAHAVPCSSIAVTWGYVSPANLAAENPTHTASSPIDLSQLLLPTAD
jgi:2-phosphoglycolate phosphatase